MFTIHDNSQSDNTGYSGVREREFVREDVRFYITKGWGGGYFPGRIPTYSIDVRLERGFYPYEWFTLYAYEGGTTYAMLSLQPQASEEDIANMVFATACQHTNTFTLLSRIARDSFEEGRRMGKHAVQTAIKQTLGIGE